MKKSVNMIHHINEMKYKSHMIISISAEKHLTKPGPIYDIKSQQSGIRGNIP